MAPLKFIIPFLLVTLFYQNCSNGFMSDISNKSSHNGSGTSGNNQGHNGIASNYPLDDNIENDPNVIFAEDFDSGNLSSLLDRWHNTKNESGMSLAQDSPEPINGGRALQMTRLGGNDTGAHVKIRLGELGEANDDQLFLRYYIKLDDYVINDSGVQGSHHHTGGGISGKNHSCNWSMGRAGIRPTGGWSTPSCPSGCNTEDEPANCSIYDNRFSVRLEARTETNLTDYGFRNDRWDFYNYWMGMHHNSSSPQYYGNSFLGDYDLQYERQEWTCVEVMVKMNNPVSASNGELKVWIDGVLIGHYYEGNPTGKWLHGTFLPETSSGYAWNNETWSYSMSQIDLAPFEGFRWRQDDRLMMNMVSLSYYVTQDTQGNARVWYDNVVVAKEYIGPISGR